MARTYMFGKQKFYLILVSVIAFLALIKPQDLAAEASCENTCDKNKFTTHESNYVIYQSYSARNRPKEQPALEVRVSFKYRLGGCKVQDKQKNKPKESGELSICSLSPNHWWGLLNRYETSSYLFYTNEFDFYVSSFNNDSAVDTRRSSPVVGRTENPGFLWSFNSTDLAQNWLHGFHLSIEHESNGQGLDNVWWQEDDQTGEPRTQEERQAYIDTFLGNNSEESFWKDSISRSIPLYAETRLDNRLWMGQPGLGSECDTSIRCFSTSIARREYGKKHEFEDTILTETGYRDDVSIADYHRYELLLRNRVLLAANDATFALKAVEFFAELHSGKVSFDQNLSADWGFIFTLASRNSHEIPLVLRFHRGPFERFSEYDENINSIGLGLQIGGVF